MKLLSEEFLAHPVHDRLPALACGFDGRIQLAVTGGPDGEVKVLATFRDGRCEERSLAVDRDAEIVLTIRHADLLDVLAGETDLNVLYMTGRLKTGDVTNTGPLIDLIAVLGSGEGRAVLSELRDAITDA